MLGNNKNNILRIFKIFTMFLLAGLIPTGGLAGEKLLLFYGNDIRSELEACG